MPTLVADCPRDPARNMTFDVMAQVYISKKYNWQTWHEVICVCRDCGKPTIFLIKLTDVHEELARYPDQIMDIQGSLNQFYSVVRPITLRDQVTIQPPPFLPNGINAAFKEGAACHAIGCYNAAACMFRLCLDLVSKPMLPDPKDTTVAQPSKHERHNLGPRLTWMFDNNILPNELRDLADCVRQDGNDGAHAGNLTQEDADDLLDFTVTFLERLVTEPEKIAAAKARQLARKQKAQQAAAKAATP